MRDWVSNHLALEPLELLWLSNHLVETVLLEHFEVVLEDSLLGLLLSDLLGDLSFPLGGLLLESLPLGLLLLPLLLLSLLSLLLGLELVEFLHYFCKVL